MSHVEEIQRQHEADDDAALRNALAAVLSTSSGRMLYRWVEAIGGIWDDPPAEYTARIAWMGKRSLALHILKAARDVDLADCQRAEVEGRALMLSRMDALRTAADLDAQNTTSLSRVIAEMEPHPNKD